MKTKKTNKPARNVGPFVGRDKKALNNAVAQLERVRDTLSAQRIPTVNLVHALWFVLGPCPFLMGACSLFGQLAEGDEQQGYFPSPFRVLEIQAEGIRNALAHEELTEAQKPPLDAPETDVAGA